MADRSTAFTELHGQWTGPRLGELDGDGRLLVELPPERWPFCVPSEHQTGCLLRMNGAVAGNYCGCDASDASDESAVA